MKNGQYFTKNGPIPARILRIRGANTFSLEVPGIPFHDTEQVKKGTGVGQFLPFDEEVITPEMAHAEVQQFRRKQMRDLWHKIAAVAGVTAGVTPVAGALPDGTPEWLKITITALGLALSIATTASKVVSKKV